MNGWRMALWAVLVVAAFVFLYLVRSILLPFLLAIITAILLEPSIRKLRRRGLSRGSAIWAVFSVFGLIVVALGIWLTPLIGNQISTLRTTVERFSAGLAAPDPNQNFYVRWNPVVAIEAPDKKDIFDRALADFQPTLTSMGLPSTRKAMYDRYVAPNSKQLAAAVQNFFDGFFGIIGNLTSQLVLLFMTPIIVIMILFDMDYLKRRGTSWIPPSIRVETIEMLTDMGNVVVNYLRGMMVATLVYMAGSALILTILGVPYSVLLGILFGALYLIPFIGQIITYAVIVAICALSGKESHLFLQFGSPWMYALVVFGCHFVFDRCFDTFVVPRIVGKAVGLNPLVSMFVIFSGGALFGLPGMILAFPMAGTVKVVLDRLVRVATVATDEMALPAIPLRHRT